LGRITTREEVAHLAAGLRKQGKKVVLTNGCFDLLHIGHLRYLQAARALGDVLAVAVNSDGSVHRLKGPDRPFVKEDERVELIAGLAAVDYAFIFSELTADANLREIRPDIYVKGGDYNRANLPETAAADACGAELVFISPIDGKSTSGLAETITRVKEGKKTDQA